MKTFADMSSAELETISCYLCHADASEPIQTHGRPITVGQFGDPAHPVLCACGMVYLNPRWTKKRLSEFYRTTYDRLYRLELKPDYGIAGVVSNADEIWRRIQLNVTGPELDRIQSILDVGCGSGHGLKHFQTQIKGSRIYGIESTPECISTLQSSDIGATLVTADIDSDWTGDYFGHFDLIVMRHVFEHVLSPDKTLAKLSTVLAEGGMIYIAVPDMMHPRTVLRDYDKWWEYWFRAVHLVYYGKATLFALLERAGLYPVAWGEENEEVWCLVSTDKSYRASYDRNVYPKQKEILRRLLP